MNFAFSEEQELLRTAARDYLADRYPVDRVVSLVESDAGWDPDSWKELDQLGWLDGVLARRLGQVTRLGRLGERGAQQGLVGPAGDRPPERRG